MSECETATTLSQNGPSGASHRYWVFHYPPNGWANRPQEERWRHVLDRAKERGSVDLTAETLASVEAEIRHVRQLAQDSKPVVPYLARRVFACKPWIRQDYYAVRIGADTHIFVWSRRCNGLISYAYKGEWKGVPHSEQKRTAAHGS